MATRVIPVGVEGNERIGAFSDGVFAIAITLLVLELKVPDPLPESGLLGALPTLAPQLAAHALSFVVIGVYWVGQHNQLLHIKRHNRVFLWLNLLFLLFVATMPFFAGLIIHHLSDRFALAMYAANLVFTGIALELMWWYASTDRRLVDPNIDPGLVSYVHRRVLIAPVLYTLAIAVSFASQYAAMAIIIAVPVLYIFPNPLDTYHHRQLAGASASAPNPDEDA
jgi:uncharacterized membrane protein